MLKFFRDTKAYVSIFLCLVLLPMVTYATMIIDATRLQSARVEIQSAGDLALNAAMSEYDQVLEDMYGLFANAKSAEELKPALTNYFNETISGSIKHKSADDEEYVRKLAEKLTELTMQGSEVDEDSLTNFLEMRLAEVPGADETVKNPAFSFVPVEESAISNPSIMKSQIVDYMKYKGPVSIASNFLNKIGFMKDMENQSKAIQSKIELTQEIAKLDDPMKEAYRAINGDGDSVKGYNQYVDAYNEYTPDRLYQHMETLNGHLDQMSRLFLCYNYVNMLYFEYTHSPNYGYEGLSTAKVNLGFQVGWQSDTELNRVVQNAASDSETVDNAIDQLNKMIAPINDIVYLDTATLEKSKYTQFENYYGAIDYTFSGDDENWTLNVGFRQNDAIYSSSQTGYKATYGSLSQWNALLNVPYSKLPEDFDYTEVFDKQIELIPHINELAEYKAYREYFEKVKKLYLQKYDEYLSIYKAKNGGDDADVTQAPDYVKYTKIKTLLEQIDSQWTSSVTYTEYKSFLNNLRRTGYYFATADSHRTAADDEFVAYYTVVKNLESTTKTAVEKLDALISQAGTVENDANTLKSDISSTVKDDSAKSQLTSDVETLAKSVNKEDAKKLRDLLDSYHTKFKTMKDKLETIRYFETEKDFLYAPYATWGNADYASRSEYQIAIDVANIHSFNDVYQKFTETAKSVSNTDIVVGHDARSLADDFRYTAAKVTGASETEAFYNVLKNTAGAEGSVSSNADSAEKKNLDQINQYTNVNSDGEPAATPSTETASSGGDGEEGTGNNSGGGNSGGSEGEGGSEVKAGNEQNFKDAIKEISPGSSNAYGQAQSVSVPGENTDAENANKSAESSKNSLSQANSLLSDIAKIGNEFKNDVYLEEYFTEMFTCQTDKLLEAGKLQMLNGYTNDPAMRRFLNTQNAWYGSEIEYILWGKDTIEANRKTTETTIFLLRFAINAIYAFTASDIQTMANSIATLLVGWTVVLVPVVQVCIVLAVALAESAIDLAELKAGKDVPIIKDQSTFRCSPSGALNSVVDYTVEKTVEYAGNKVTEAVDSLSNMAEKTAEEKATQVRKTVDAYVDAQRKSLETAISDNFTSPLITCITPALSRINMEADNAEELACSLLTDSIDEAWTVIGNNIDTMENGTIRELTSRMYTLVGEGLRKQMVNEIIAKMKQTTGELKLPTPGEVQNIINAKVSSWMDQIKGDINSSLQEIQTEMLTKLNQKIEEGADDLKGYMNEQIENAGKQLGGSVKETISSVTDSSIEVGTSSKSVASKITMNYKEYCKLFMFIGLLNNSNENTMLQRAAVLMQLNVNYAVKGGSSVSPAGNEKFKMNQAYTLFYLNADVKMGTLFPWAVEIEDDGTDVEANLDLSHLGQNYVTIKYSGIAGY